MLPVPIQDFNQGKSAWYASRKAIKKSWESGICGIGISSPSLSLVTTHTLHLYLRVIFDGWLLATTTQVKTKLLPLKKISQKPDIRGGEAKKVISDHIMEKKEGDEEKKRFRDRDLAPVLFFIRGTASVLHDFILLHFPLILSLMPCETASGYTRV